MKPKVRQTPTPRNPKGQWEILQKYVVFVFVSGKNHLRIYDNLSIDIYIYVDIFIDIEFYRYRYRYRYIYICVCVPVNVK